MNTYQDLFMQPNSGHFDPSTILTQQNHLALMLPDMTPTQYSGLDDWLANELCKSGVISNALDFLQNESKQQEIMAMLSPPITPLSSNLSDSGSSLSSQPKSLFPEIQYNKSLPRLAPKPSNFTTKPAPVIVPSPKRKLESIKDTDEVVMKRQKNTDAARRSRMKKLMKMETLESKVSDLENENHGLNTRIAVLESEKAGIEAKDASLQDRIRVLESQLAEAHRALTKL
ncbi:hypothetical protein BDB01DRAFT_837272 [Pilobolus umbonatus]|nr:hypothetical protein BDB01DRAFT_837272 [Pilobolus umbonatus]